jgi:hypothetical protein
MPAGLPQGTPLARLAAHDTQSRVLKNTTFHEEDSHDEIQVFIFLSLQQLQSF